MTVDDVETAVAALAERRGFGLPDIEAVRRAGIVRPGLLPQLARTLLAKCGPDDLAKYDVQVVLALCRAFDPETSSVDIFNAIPVPSVYTADSIGMQNVLFTVLRTVACLRFASFGDVEAYRYLRHRISACPELDLDAVHTLSPLEIQVMFVVNMQMRVRSRRRTSRRASA